MASQAWFSQATAGPLVTSIDHRQLGRDSLFLMAEVRLAGAEAEHRVKVRNLSAGGMMAEGAMKVLRGTPVEVNLRNIGWVDGVVAWIQDNRFGIAFVEEIDPKLARAPVGTGASTPRFVKPPIAQVVGPLRKI
ncbi:MAG: PilZ domain-containing protein [Novosphingobium sp.]